MWMNKMQSGQVLHLILKLGWDGKVGILEKKERVSFFTEEDQKIWRASPLKETP